MVWLFSRVSGITLLFSDAPPLGETVRQSGTFLVGGGELPTARMIDASIFTKRTIPGRMTCINIENCRIAIALFKHLIFLKNNH